MKSMFMQTAEYSTKSVPGPDDLKNLPEGIYKHTGWGCSCQQTETGCFLTPPLRSIPYRKSLVLEIDIAVSRHDAQTVLHMQGQPVEPVRIFMAIWFGSCLMMEVFLLALAITSNLDGLFPVFIPMIMGLFGYLLCKIGTMVTFRSVVKAIQKELK